MNGVESIYWRRPTMWSISDIDSSRALNSSSLFSMLHNIKNILLIKYEWMNDRLVNWIIIILNKTIYYMHGILHEAVCCVIYYAYSINKETFLLNFLEILNIFPRGTTCVVISSACSNLQPHNYMLPCLQRSVRIYTVFQWGASFHEWKWTDF